MQRTDCDPHNPLDEAGFNPHTFVDMTLVSQLLIVANAFCQARTLAVSRVSTLVFNDGKALARLARGGDLHTGSYERAMIWFSIHWPEGAEWPADVPRPAPLHTEETAA